MWVRGGMVTSVLVLGVLILVTPILLGRPTSELSSLPMLIVGWSGNQSYLIVYATGALQQYQYKLIRLAFRFARDSQKLQVNPEAQSVLDRDLGPVPAHEQGWNRGKL